MNPRLVPTLSFNARHPQRTVLVTGASGYVGGRLITELVSAGFTVRATSRNVDSLRRFDWKDDVELVQADLLDLNDVTRIMQGVDIAFYLVHSMGEKGEDFELVEQRSASPRQKMLARLQGALPSGPVDLTAMFAQNECH